MAGTGRRLTNRFLSYIAGLFDGEGCIRYSDRSLRVSITSCYPVHLHKIMDLLGMGRISKHPPSGNRRTCFKLCMDGVTALAFIKLIRPYLIEKAYQADLAMLIPSLPAKSCLRNSLIRDLSDCKRIDYG